MKAQRNKDARIIWWKWRCQKMRRFRIWVCGNLRSREYKKEIWIYENENMKILKYEDMKIWGNDDTRIWKYEDMEIWGYADMKIRGYEITWRILPSLPAPPYLHDLAKSDQTQLTLWANKGEERKCDACKWQTLIFSDCPKAKMDSIWFFWN